MDPLRGSRRFARMAMRGTALLFGALALIVAAIVVRWIAVGGVEGGLDAFGRLLRHGTTDVYDFRLYPARRLAPSSQPRPFAAFAPFSAFAPSAPSAGAPALHTGPDGRAAPLHETLRSTRTLAFVVIRNDRIEFEYGAPGHGPAAASQFFSASKSVLATLVGLAIDDGLIRSIDQPLTDFVPELADQGFRATTLRQLLDMRSGLDYTENDNPFGLHVLMNYTSQLEPLLLGFTADSAGAGLFRYKSGDTALVSLALQRALAPTSLTAYAQRRLWEPLGMEHGAVWSLDHEGGLEKAWCCLAGTARDLARLGRLYLAGGRVGTTQLLSSAWVADSLPRVSALGEREYRLSWWPASVDGRDFAAVGKAGQILFVSPAHDTVIVRLGEQLGFETAGQWLSLMRAIAARPQPDR